MVMQRFRTRLTWAKSFAARLNPISKGAKTRGKRIILHIGPHRTGTTTIQHTLNRSADVFPERIGALTRDNETQKALSRITHGVKTQQAARRRMSDAKEAAANVAALCTAETTIICDEDLIGALPGRRDQQGLYPFFEILFPQVLAGLGEHGATVTVAWTTRSYRDWLESVYHRRYELEPTRAFGARRFRMYHGLPASWRFFEARLLAVCEDVEVVQLSFESDLKAGKMGHGLLQLAGMSDVEIKALNHARAKNVSRLRRGGRMPTVEDNKAAPQPVAQKK